MDLEVRAAYDDELIETLPGDDLATARARLERAYARYRDRSGWLPKARRISVLERAADLVARRREELARQAAREGGKPLADSRVELARAEDGLRIAARELSLDAGREIPMGISASSAGRLALTHREPRGVVLAVSAFNHPFNLAVHQAVPAVAAGCPVLLKPALTTPLSARSLVGILHEAGLDADLCQLLVCPDEVTEALVGDARVAYLTFIGSARVGWSLRSRLAPGAACMLEHGGAAPVILDETADLDLAVPLLVKGCFAHAGQVCVSGQRLFVHASRAAELAERMRVAVEELRVGDPLDPLTDVGPLILPREVDRVAEWVQEALAGGGQLLVGGQRLSARTYAPTLVFDPPATARLSREEIFGPVAALYPYTDLDAAVSRANATDYYFQASVFTRDLERALDLSRRLEGTTVLVNDHTAFRVDWMPFGGHRASGLGLGGIGPAMRDMSIERLVIFRSPALG